MSPVIHAVRLVTSVGLSRLRAAASMPARVSVNKLARITVLLPEPAARREIDLRQRLRRQRRDRFGLQRRAASARSRCAAARAAARPRSTWRARDAAAVGARDDGAVVARAQSPSTAWSSSTPLASAAAIASGIRCTPSRAVKPRLSDGRARAALRERAAEQQQQRGHVVRVAAEAHVQPYASAIARSLKPQAAEPLVRRDVERRVLRVEPVAGAVERVVAHREHAVVVPRQLLLVALAGNRWRDASATRSAE